ncbi:unnamed protein product [Hermetia illucens]|uniref:Cyclin-K n=2 Tax=Hermetia illucens TaxID=343691 RepID=A0A7R8UT80_HERIL|nr:unnamed protein product [Hermetia illucens]
MPCWYYEKKDLKVTPSILDGISYETERRYRKEGARFIIQCGTAMSLGHNTVATGVVYFHRFYMFHSFKTFPRYVTACCCLFLAGKVEETPKKAKDIIKTARSLLSDEKFFSFGDDPKEEVMTLERILLQTIKFDLQVEHPYSFLVKYAKCFKGDQGKLQKMVQMAWNFVNDSLSTTVCLQWEPEIIAVALIHLASKLSKFTVVDWIGKQPHHLRWWDMFVADVTMEILEDICHQVLDLYQQSNNNHNDPVSPPQQPSSKASPPAKRANTSPQTTKQSPVAPQNPPPKPPPEEKVEGNPIQKLVPPDLRFVYPPTGYGPPPYAAHAAPPHFSGMPVAGGPGAPPPPQPPPIYGGQYPPPPQVPPHYPPASMTMGHLPPPAHHPPYYAPPPPGGSRPYYPS